MFTNLPLLAGINKDVQALDDRPLTQFLHEQWEYEKDLPLGRITDIHICKNGFLWLCGYEGLFRYDGSRYFEYSKKDYPQLLGGCAAIYEDHDGTLWIGSNGNGIIRLKKGIFNSWGIKEGLDFSIYRRLFHDFDGNLVVPGNMGLQTIINNKVVSYPIKGLDQFSIRELIFMTNRTLYLGLWDGRLLYCPNPDEQSPRFETIYLPENSGTQVRALAEGKHGELWIGTNNGTLYKYTSQNEFKSFTPPGGPVGDSTWHIEIDSENRLWAGCTEGIVRVIHDKAEWYKPDQSYDQDAIIDVTFTLDGAVFFSGYTSGLHLLMTPKLNFMTEKDGLPGKNINSITKDHTGKIWIATNKGIVTYENNQFTAYRDDLFAHNIVRDIYWDTEGRLWVSQPSQGTTCIDQNEIYRYNFDNGLPSNRTRTVCEGIDNTTWIGSQDGLSRIKNNKVEKVYTTDNGLRSNYILSLYKDQKDRVWVSMAGGGLAYIENNDIISVTNGTVADASVVFSCYEHHYGSIIAGSTNGLVIVDKDLNVSLKKINEFEDNEALFGVLKGHENDYWLICSKSLKRVKQHAFENFVFGTSKTLEFETYNSKNALPTRLVRANARNIRDSENRIWIPLFRGIAIISNDKIVTNSIPPKTTICSVKLDETLSFQYPIQSHEIIVKPGVKRIEIEYSGLSFQNQKHVLFKIRLKGFEDWIETTNSRAIYTSLPPKSYQFELLARNADGIWSAEPTILKLTIKPAFHENIYIRLIAVVILASIILLIFRWRVLELRVASKKLEQKVEKRTQELKQKNAQIEANYKKLTRMSKDLFANASALKTANDNKNHFLSITAHDLRNAVSGMVSCAHLLNDMNLKSQNTNNTKDSDELIQIIIKKGTILLDTIQQLLGKENTEQSDLKLTLETRNLNDLVQDVIEMNRPLAIRKNQSLLYSSTEKIVLKVDPLQIRMAIDNYISNAIKYTKFGSTIEISAHTIIEQNQTFAMFQVSDEGPGLTEKDKTRVFTKFAQLSAKPTGDEHSSGIGLSIVKEIIVRHNGSIGVDSEPGNGAIFYFKLPVE